MRLPQLEPDEKYATNVKESVRDFAIGSGEYVIKDFKFTVNQAVRPVEKRFDKMKRNIKFRQSRDDNWVSPPTPERTIRGIDDPLISGSAGDSVISKARRHHRDSSSAANVDRWGGSDQASDGYVIRGRSWAIKKSCACSHGEAMEFEVFVT